MGLYIIFQVFGGGGNIITSQARTFRLVRVIRALRVLRALVFAGDLRRMIFALQYAGGTLLWAFFLLMFTMYCFALAFTQATTEKLLSAGDTIDLAQLHDRYGSIGKSYMSLFMAITGGISWGELTTPLSKHTHIIYTIMFVIFVAVTVFGVPAIFIVGASGQRLENVLKSPAASD